MQPPHREQVRDVPASDVNDVLLLRERRKIDHGPSEKFQMTWYALRIHESSIKPDDVRFVVAAGCRNKADARATSTTEAKHVVVQHGFVLHREPASSHREDLLTRHR